MREILFRGKRVDNGEWVKGDLLREKDIFGIVITRIYQIKGDGYFAKHEVDPNTVCQYTGLTDKNGKEIFEGDIIKTHLGGRIGGIKYGLYQRDFEAEGTGHIGFYVDWPECCYYRMELGYWINTDDSASDIGNIFDNPELIAK